MVNDIGMDKSPQIDPISSNPVNSSFKDGCRNVHEVSENGGNVDALVVVKGDAYRGYRVGKQIVLVVIWICIVRRTLIYLFQEAYAL